MIWAERLASVVGVDHACPLYQLLPRESDSSRFVDIETFMCGTTKLINSTAWQNFPVLHILNNANINRYSPNDTAQDGSEVTGSRIVDPSVSNLTSGSCENLNVTGYGCGPAVGHVR